MLLLLVVVVVEVSVVVIVVVIVVVVVVVVEVVEVVVVVVVAVAVVVAHRGRLGGTVNPQSSREAGNIYIYIYMVIIIIISIIIYIYIYREREREYSWGLLGAPTASFLPGFELLRYMECQVLTKLIFQKRYSKSIITFNLPHYKHVCVCLALISKMFM